MLWPFFKENIYIFSIIFKPIVSNESILNNSMSLSLKVLFINFKSKDFLPFYLSSICKNRMCFMCWSQKICMDKKNYLIIYSYIYTYIRFKTASQSNLVIIYGTNNYYSTVIDELENQVVQKLITKKSSFHLWNYVIEYIAFNEINYIYIKVFVICSVVM